MENLKVFIKGETDIKEIKSGTTLLEISKDYAHLCKEPILLAKVNNDLFELTDSITFDCNVEFFDITNSNAYRVYQRSLSFLMIYAIKEVMGKETTVIIEHSINKNFYCEIPEKDITEEIIVKIEEKMQEAVDKDFPIERINARLDDVIDTYESLGMSKRSEAFRYLRDSYLSIHKLDWFLDYQHGPMLPSAAYMNKFKLHKYADGVLLQFPMRNNPKEFNENENFVKISQVFRESAQWARILGVDTVPSLNNAICNNNIKDIILISEALHEKKISNIADMIANQHKNIVLIAGPSSSGKTTFANRLCTQLRANGLKSYILSIDDYYLNREFCPIDEDGKPNFEILEAIDVTKFNEDLVGLLNKETIELPTFNFKTGKREYNGQKLKLHKDEVLVIEGIHGLNERLTPSVPRENKFKAYISALTQLGMDYHNRIPTTDTRLIRRLVRDSKFRGFNAISTFDIWPSVVKGESQNIFPFQEEADVMFNSALVYELCVLKQFVEPLLFSIDKDLPHYIEAKRLIKFLDSFLSVNCTEIIPINSIIREFIGGSCYH